MQPSAQKLKTYQLLSLVLAVVVVVLCLALLVKRNGGLISGSSISPDILALTQPVLSVSATVLQNNGTTLVVSYSPQAGQLLGPGVPNTTPVVKLTYTVLLGANTTITKQQAPLAPGGISQAPKYTSQDIHIGSTVTVVSKVDLRTLQSNSFTASAIVLSPDVTTLNGKIVSVSGNTVVVNGIPSMPFGPSLLSSRPQQPKEYQITVIATTSIVEASFGGVLPEKPGIPTQQKLTLTDLKKDMNVSVRTNQDILSATSLTAVSIQVLTPQVLPLLPQSSASGSQPIKPS